MEGASWQDWVQWKQRCALTRCDCAARRRLAAFAQARLKRAVTRLAGVTNLPASVWRRIPEDPELAWHLFESHAVVTHTRQGKAYKEWLFARAGDGCESPLDTVVAGATLMMRDVARAWVAKECLPRDTVTLDAPVAGTEGTITYVDLLPTASTPLNAIEAHERAEYAAHAATRVFGHLDYRQRLVVAARLRGIPFDRDELLQATGWKRAMIYRACNRIFDSIRPLLQKLYPDESDDQIRLLLAGVCSELENQIDHWLAVENVLPLLFQEEQSDSDLRVVS
jgi:hypothetical protein